MFCFTSLEYGKYMAYMFTCFICLHPCQNTNYYVKQPNKGDKNHVEFQLKLNHNLI